MKNLPDNKTCRTISVIMLTGLVFQGCSTYNRIYSEKDVVRSTERSELKYSVKDWNRRSPLLYSTQSVLREFDQEEGITFTAYDVLTLTSSSFKLDEKVYFIIDNEVFPMTIYKMELENVKKISEDKADIVTSDSSTVSVVTGYSEDNRKITRFSYEIPVSVMKKIKDSNQFSRRYYSGPSMMTVKPRHKSIRKLKQLAEMI